MARTRQRRSPKIGGGLILMGLMGAAALYFLTLGKARAAVTEMPTGRDAVDGGGEAAFAFDDTGGGLVSATDPMFGTGASSPVVTDSGVYSTTPTTSSTASTAPSTSVTKSAPFQSVDPARAFKVAKGSSVFDTKAGRNQPLPYTPALTTTKAGAGRGRGTGSPAFGGIRKFGMRRAA